MIAREIENAVDVEAIVSISKMHKSPERDCSPKDYARFLRYLAGKPGIKMWVLVDMPLGRYAGYIIASRQNDIANQVNVLEVLLHPDYRGTNNIKMLTECVRQWCVEDGAKRVMWTSEWDKAKWETILGLKVKEKRILSWEVEV